MNIPDSFCILSQRLGELESRVFGTCAALPDDSEAMASIPEKLKAVREKMESSLKGHDAIAKMLKRTEELHSLLGPLNEETVPDAIKMTLVLSQAEAIKETGAILTSVHAAMMRSQDTGDQTFKDVIALGPRIALARDQQRELAQEVIRMKEDLELMADKVKHMSTTLANLLSLWNAIIPEVGAN